MAKREKTIESKKRRPKQPREQELPNMPMGDVSAEVRRAAEEYVDESKFLSDQKEKTKEVGEKLLLLMARDKVNVAVVVKSNRKYYIRLERKDAKLKVEVGPIVPSTNGSV